MRFDITPADVAKSLDVDPGWHPAELMDVQFKPGKNDPNSTTAWLEFQVLEGPSAGRSITTWIGSGAVHILGIPFIKAVAPHLLSDSGISVDFGDFVGTKVMIEVVAGTYNGKPSPKVNGFAPLAAFKRPTPPAPTQGGNVTTPGDDIPF